MSSAGYDTTIRNGTVVTTAGSQRLTVGIRDGKIAALAEPSVALPAERDIDAEGQLVLPGGIDTHTHVSWPYRPGMVTDDGFDGAGAAAAVGGTTTMIDFVPPVLGDQRLHQAACARIDQIEGETPIDVGLHQIITGLDSQALADIPRVIEAGLTSFKMFTTYEHRVNDGEIWQLMQCIAANGGQPGFHAENHEMIEQSTDALSQAGRTTMQDFEASRPALAEATAIETVTLMARQLNSPVFIFHVSGTLALEAIDAARASGTLVNAETCTHYLTFDDSVFSSDEKWKFTITPPIRSAADRDELWGGVREGRITTVGSDHAAYPADEKAAHPEDYRQGPLGAAGVQNRSTVLWDEVVNKRGMPAELFAAISAERPARALGMFPRKGTVAVGSDADLVILDPDRSWNGGSLQAASPSTFCLYDKYDGRGLPRHVLSRGKIVVSDFGYCGEPGSGKFLARDRVTS